MRLIKAKLGDKQYDSHTFYLFSVGPREDALQLRSEDEVCTPWVFLCVIEVHLPKLPCDCRVKLNIEKSRLEDNIRAAMQRLRKIMCMLRIGYSYNERRVEDILEQELAVRA